MTGKHGDIFGMFQLARNQFRKFKRVGFHAIATLRVFRATAAARPTIRFGLLEIGGDRSRSLSAAIPFRRLLKCEFR